jgi:hypothetical protein
VLGWCSYALHVLGNVFKDVNVLYVINIETVLAADVNDSDITNDHVSSVSTILTYMSTMRFKISLYQLSARICKAVSSKDRLSEAQLVVLEANTTSE